MNPDCMPTKDEYDEEVSEMCAEDKAEELRRSYHDYIRFLKYKKLLEDDGYRIEMGKWDVKIIKEI